ncbi:MAG TPA: hypothetical protein DDW49_10180 [Deltaproteobacteria bacterium]|nr:MAG: hypothetical protein A2048_08235 [Deltaproteobacteria bacterium GWA2_45_12]HBF13729.1 hypothetical protein [Deltaproteobacteria bacterium]
MGSIPGLFQTVAVMQPPPMPEEAPLPPAPEEIQQDRYTEITPDPSEVKIRVTSDSQLLSLAEVVSLLRSLEAHSVVPTAIRLPGQNISPGHLLKLFAYQMNKSIDPTHQHPDACSISTGDEVDTNSSDEWTLIKKIWKELFNATPSTRLCAIAPSNHAAEYTGVTTMENSVAGFLLSIVLHTWGSKRNIKDQVAIPESGGYLENKGDAIKHYYEMMGIPYKVTRLNYSHNSDYLIATKGTDKEASPEDEEIWKAYDWSVMQNRLNSPQIYKHFWNEETLSKGTKLWHSTVQFTPGSDHDPKESTKNWLHLSAFEMKTFSMGGQTVPVYYINMDSMDYSHAGFDEGASLLGHVSDTQVKIVRAYMDEMKRRNPQAKFVIGGHYQFKQIVELESSGFARMILSDESVIALLEAHVHQRGYYNARYLPGVNRKTDLPAVTAPAIIDNAEALTIDLKKIDDDVLRVSFHYETVNPANGTSLRDGENDIPGTTPEVMSLVESLKSNMLVYLDHYDHIQDRLMKVDASRNIGLYDKFTNIFDTREFSGDQKDLTGILIREGVGNDEVISKDSIPGMVMYTRQMMDLAFHTIRLTLREAGIPESETKKYEELYIARRKILDAYYESIMKNGSQPRADHDLFHALDEQAMDFITEANKIANLIRSGNHNGTNFTPQQRELLEVIEHISTDLAMFVEEDYKSWLRSFERLVRTKRPYEEIARHGDLFGRPHFISMTQHLQSDIPFGSHAFAFLTRVGLESIKQYEAYVGKTGQAPHTKIPDTIIVERKLSTGQARMTPVPNTKSIPGAEEQMHDELDKKTGGRLKKQEEEARALNEEIKQARGEAIVPRIELAYFPDLDTNPFRNALGKGHRFSVGIQRSIPGLDGYLDAGARLDITHYDAETSLHPGATPFVKVNSPAALLNVSMGARLTPTENTPIQLEPGIGTGIGFGDDWLRVFWNMNPDFNHPTFGVNITFGPLIDGIEEFLFK